MRIITFLILGLFSITIHAQNVVNSSSGKGSATSGSVSYSVGYISYTNASDASGSVSNGVQQPYEFNTVGIDDRNDINLEMILYPNPTNEFIKLKYETESFNNLSYELFDINGKLIQQNKIEASETNISMQNLAKSSYFLNVIESGKQIKSFKIIKNQ